VKVTYNNAPKKQPSPRATTPRPKQDIDKLIEEALKPYRDFFKVNKRTLRDALHNAINTIKNKKEVKENVVTSKYYNDHLSYNETLNALNDLLEKMKK